MSEIKEQGMPETAEKKARRKWKLPKKKTLILGGASLLAVFLIVSNLTKKPVLPTVAVSVVTRGDIEQTLDTSGIVSSMMTKTYYSPVSASIDRLPYEVGDNVSEGDLIVSYDLDSISDEVKKANLQLTASRSGYNDSINKSNQKNDEFHQAEKDLDTLKQQAKEAKDKLNSLKDQLKQLTNQQQTNQSSSSAQNAQKRSALQKESSDLNVETIQLKADLEQLNVKIGEKQKRLDELTATVSVPTAITDQPQDDGTATPAEATPVPTTVPAPTPNPEIETLTNEINAMKAEVQQKEGRTLEIEKRQAEITGELALLGEGGSSDPQLAAQIADIQAQVEAASADFSQKEADLAKKEGVRDSAQASILSEDARQQLQANTNLTELSAMSANELLQLARSGIKAEFSGIVTDVRTKPGASTMEGGELITVSSNRDVMTEISITKYDLEKIKTGQKATITLAGSTYTGTVEKISKVAVTNAQGTPVIRAQVSFDNPDDNVYLGVEAKVSVSTAQASNVLLIPVEAINNDRSGAFVYVVREHLLQKQPIETGVTSDDMAEVVSGLSESDLIVLSVAAGLQEGTQVNTVQQ